MESGPAAEGAGSDYGDVRLGFHGVSRVASLSLEIKSL
jgi:hypothetical protein